MVPAPDPLARDYLLLALRLGQRIEGLVDGYFGPRDLKAQAETEQLRAPERLAEDAAALRARVGAEAGAEDRARWLDSQLVALETIARGEAGERLPYEEEVRRCFDAAPERLPAATYARVRSELAAALPGTGELRDRLAAWAERFVVPVDRLPEVVDWLVPRLREAAVARFGAPEGESVRVGLVTGQPWSGYNWYDGAFRSRVDINTDLPVRGADLIATLAHETYPGHHLEHAWKEAMLVQEAGRLESSILLINTPECYVSEGLAELGRRYTVDPAAWRELLVGTYESSGIAAGPEDADRQSMISAAMAALRGAGGDAALMLHAEGWARADVQRFLEEEALMDADRAAKRIDFVSHPLWRTYVFSYAGGERLLRRWCDSDGPEQAPARFGRLLREQLTPSGLAESLSAEVALDLTA